MTDKKPTRDQDKKRQALWLFEQVDTLRSNIIQRAGRLLRPQGRLILSMAANDAVQNQFMDYMARLDTAA